MTKFKTQRKVVGTKNLVNKTIPRELEKVIKKRQAELQSKQKKNKKGNRISFAWAGLEIAMELEGKK